MDRLTPSPSFRPSPPIRRTSPPHLMHRTRNESLPPRRTRNASPPPRKPIVIPTDWHAFQHTPTSASPPDTDLIFHMSPVLAHNDAASSSSPRFSPPIYSFPHASDRFAKGRREHAPVPSKNARTPTFAPPLSPRGINVTTPRPLVSSLRESTYSPRREASKNFISPNNLAHPGSHAHSPSGSSPIPIPRPPSRGRDPRPVARPSPALFISPGVNLSPAVRCSRRTPPSRRVEGFADEPENEDDDESDTDSHTPSTAYSCGSDPFRLEKFLDDPPRWLQR